MDHLILLAIFIVPSLFLLCLSGKKSTNWAPFQSDQVKEICRHMTDEERGQAVKRSSLFALMIGLAITSLNLVLIPFAFWLSQNCDVPGIIIMPFVLIAMVIAVAWNRLPLKKKLEQSAKEFYASTQWAKQQGLTPEQIKLRRNSR
jgi:uncharacterized membrane protein